MLSTKSSEDYKTCFNLNKLILTEDIAFNDNTKIRVSDQKCLLSKN